jgi:recombination protein RecT
MTNAVTTTESKALSPQQQKVHVIERELVRLAPQIAKQLPNGMSEERFQVVTLQALAKNADLLDCDPSSVILAVLDAAGVGLEPTGVLSQAWLVPYKPKDATKAKAQLQIGYNGYRTLARRSGEVSSIEARVVYEGDLFEVHYGSDQRIVHTPSFETSDPSKITHAYAVTRMKDGTIMFDIMTRAELDGIRARSRSANRGPWVTDTAEMYRKTVIRRHVKALPLTVEATRVIERDDEAEFGGGNLAESPAASRTAEVRERIRANSGKRRQTPKSGQGAPEAEDVAPVGAPDDSADQRTNEDTVEGESREVCGATSDPKLGEVETCALDAGHLAVERAPQSHQSAGGSVWPAVPAKRQESES